MYVKSVVGSFGGRSGEMSVFRLLRVLESVSGLPSVDPGEVRFGVYVVSYETRRRRIGGESDLRPSVGVLVVRDMGVG